MATAATNMTSSEEDDSLGEHLTAFEFYFYLVNGLLGTLFNSVVMWIALRHTDTHDKPRQILVINMTFADLMTCLVYMLTRPYLNRFPFVICYPYYVCIFSSQLCSCVNLLWLNMDKLIYIKFPLRYYQLVTRARILVLSALSWFTLLTVGLTIYTFMTVKHACNAVLISPFIYLPVCVIYVILIMASFIISAIIYCIAHNSRRLEPQAQSKLFQRLFFVFSSTLWTFVTCLPYRIFYLTYAICPPCHSEQFGEIFYKLTDTFFSILVLGIVINPVITVFTQRLYRECLLMYLTRMA
ncbi:Protein AEX-2, partial [Aphelenchoides avenae]